MIASLRGKIIHKTHDSLTLEVNQVGYHVILSPQTLLQLSESEEVFLHIYTSVREDDISLFGFRTFDEKKLFLKLITVNGIGPKMALTIQSKVSIHALVESLQQQDVSRLTAIPGIGKKTAERMIVFLKDKFDDFDTSVFSSSDIPEMVISGTSHFSEALSALVNLGYSKPAAEKILRTIPELSKTPLEEIIKISLNKLA